MLQHLLNSDGWKVLFFRARFFSPRCAQLGLLKRTQPQAIWPRAALTGFFSAGALIGGRDVDADLMAGWLVDLNRGA